MLSKETIRLYQDMLLETVDVMIDRFDPDYGFIDTKIDIFTGEDLSRGDGTVDLYGRDTVYAWIQSRGIEALCEHLRWIESGDALVGRPPGGRSLAEYREAIRRIVGDVVEKLERIRLANGGTLFFWFDREGVPFKLTADGRKLSFRPASGSVCDSDQFHIKALPAAGRLLNDRRLLDAAPPFFDQWLAALYADRLIEDQQPFDPRNPVAPVPGRHTHGSHMITIGAFSVYADVYAEQRYIDGGFACIAHILDRYVNLDGRFPGLDELDFVEFIDDGGAPYVHEGAVLCDPGHTAEFVGLSLKFLNQAEACHTCSNIQQKRAVTWRELLPRILLHNAAKGHNPIGGFYKSIDQLTGRPFNSDMPWWNLPETMRAGLLAHNATSDNRIKQQCRHLVEQTSAAFLRLYVLPEVHRMAYQTLDARGRPLRTLPATPDLDPGYHTGLSLLDCFEALTSTTGGCTMGCAG